MNRRHFLAAALPAMLGATALGAKAETTAEPTPLPRRIKIEVSQLKTDSEFGGLVANTVVVVADEGVETYAAFTHVNNFHYTVHDDAKTKRTELGAQAIVNSLRVTPRVGADGKITVDVKVEIVEPIASADAVPDPTVTGAAPTGTMTENVQNSTTVESGQATMLHVPAGFKSDIRLTATLLGPHETV